MNEVIYLKDNKEKTLELVLKDEASIVYKRKYIEEGLEELAKKGLKYNTKTGVTYIGREERERFSDKEDIPKYSTVEEVLEDQFVQYVLNSASRLERGYTAV